MNSKQKNIVVNIFWILALITLSFGYISYNLGFNPLERYGELVFNISMILAVTGMLFQTIFNKDKNKIPRAFAIKLILCFWLYLLGITSIIRYIF